MFHLHSSLVPSLSLAPMKNKLKTVVFGGQRESLGTRLPPQSHSQLLLYTVLPIFSIVWKRGGGGEESGDKDGNEATTSWSRSQTNLSRDHFQYCAWRRVFLVCYTGSDLGIQVRCGSLVVILFICLFVCLFVCLFRMAEHDLI